MISYAQNFEDVMLARVFAGRTGFYVDVGAGDPVNLSVTKWFYDQGWSGLNIEPNEQLFERLKADRPRDITLPCGAGASAYEAAFFEPAIGELSSFEPRIQEQARIDGTTGTTRLVPVFPLSDILQRHCPGQHIDFLKIDVEGWEHEVLKGIDLNLHRPVVLLIEATMPRQQAESHADWAPLVLRANYSPVYFDGVNRFYLANERLDLKVHFNSPPNVFDDFQPFPLVRATTDSEERLKAMSRLEDLLAVSERDRESRLSQVDELVGLLAQANLDRATRLSRIDEVDGLLAKADQDRTARLSQIEELGGLLIEANLDRAARLIQIDELTVLLSAANEDRAARLTQIQELGSLLAEANLDRAARLTRIDELTGLLGAANEDRAARLTQIEQLSGLLAEANRDRNAQLPRIEELGKLLAEADQDRAARLIQIEQLGGLLAEANLDRAARLTQIQELGALLADAKHHEAAQKDRAERLETTLTEAHRDLAAGVTKAHELERLLQEANSTIDRIRQSLLWRVTHPKWLQSRRRT